jgi:polyisoprenoid-binding protein YceI
VVGCAVGGLPAVARAARPGKIRGARKSPHPSSGRFPAVTHFHWKNPEKARGTRVALSTRNRSVPSGPGRDEDDMAVIFVHCATLAVSLTALAFGTGAALAQDAAGPLALAKTRVSIAGSSNVHEYTASTTTARLVRVQLAPGVAPTLQALVAPGAIEAFEIAIPAATLSSEKDGLDKNMHKSLKVTEHKDITFRLGRLEAAAAAGAYRATGVLRVAGVERTTTFDVTVEQTGGTLVVRGKVPLLMTDFGIASPKAMLGMLKTDPKVTVTFETVVSVPLT